MKNLRKLALQLLLFNLRRLLRLLQEANKINFYQYFVKTCLLQKLLPEEQKIQICTKNKNFVESLSRPKKFLNTNAYSAGILQQSMGVRNRVGIGLSYRPARLHRLGALKV
jgi:hypothetical protein